MSLKIKESELKDILAEVAEDLAKAFDSEKTKLSKADGEAPPKEEPAEDTSGGPPAEGSEGSDAPPAADASASAPGAESPAPGPDASPAPQGVDPAADQAAALTPEALQAEYGKLSPEELDMHIKAALAAKAVVAGGMPPDAGGAMPPPDMSAGAPAGAPPMPPAASPSPAGPPGLPPPPPQAPLMQSEKGEQIAPSPERKGERSIDSLGKSEFQAFTKAQNDKVAALEALVKNQHGEIEALTKIAKLIVEQPLRKAITTVAYQPRSEEPKKELKDLNKTSFTAHLSKLSARPDLKKADRQLINDYFDGVVKVEALAPLFEDYK